MKIQYFGDPSNPKIVVLHPMLLDGKSMLPLLGELRNSHCVIAPDLTGHGTDTGIFQSAQQEAETLADWLTTQGWIDLKLVFGASIGAVVAMQLIAMPTFKVHTAVLEGCPLHSNAAFLRMMATRMFLSKHRKAQQHPGLSAQRMTKIYGETLGLIMGYTFEQIRPETLQAIAAACSDCTFPNYPKELEAHLFLSMAVRTSAPRPRAGLSQSTIRLLPLQSGKAMFTANIPPFWESSIPRYWSNTSPGDFNNRTQEAAWGTFHHAAFSIVSNRQNRIGFSCVLSVPACFLKWRTILSM